MSTMQVSVAWDGPPSGPVVESVATAVADARAALGLTQVEIAVRVESRPPVPAEFMACRLDGRLLVVCTDDALAARAAATDHMIDRRTRPETVLDELAADSALAGQVLVEACRVAIERNPAVLVGGTDAADLPWPPDVDGLAVLRQVVGRGVGVQHWSEVVNGIGRVGDQRVLVEQLVDRLEPARIRVLAAPETVCRLTVALEATQSLPYLREGLLAENGIPLPDIEFVPDAAVRPGQWRFGIGPLCGAPGVGLPKGRVLVNADPDRLRSIELTAQPAADPMSARQYATTDDAAEGRLRELGFTTWDEPGYLVYSLACHLRRRALRLVRVSSVRRMLDRVASVRPGLVDALRACCDVETTTAAFADLVAAGGNLGSSLVAVQALGDFTTGLLPGDRTGELRQALADRVAARWGSRAALSCYLLDPQLEEHFAEHAAGQGDPADTPFARELVEAYLEEAAVLPAGKARPSVLVAERSRAAVAAALAARLPYANVVGYLDIPPDHLVQPVSRLGGTR